MRARFRLGIDWDEIRVLEALSLLDFHVLTTLESALHSDRRAIDHAQFELALRRSSITSTPGRSPQRLLVSGAPRHLMSRLYGWVPQQYRSQRRMLRPG